MHTSIAFELLRVGVPLSLLMDLWPADGPDSREIMRVERAGSQMVGVA